MRGRIPMWRATMLPAIYSALTLTNSSSHAQCMPHTGNGTPPLQCCKPVGPDVIVGDLQEFANFTVGTTSTIDVFSFGTTSCNTGDAPVTWVASTNKHPVVGQNIFKMKNTG